MVAAHVSSSSHFDVKQRSTSHAVHREMINLVLEPVRSEKSKWVCRYCGVGKSLPPMIMLLNAHHSVPVVILYSASFPSHQSLMVYILRPDLAFRSPIRQQHVLTLRALEGRLQLFIGFFFHVIADIGRWVTLYNGHVDLPALQTC